MSSMFESLMQDVCKQALVNDIAKFDRFDFNDISVRPITAEEILTLAQKITALPLEYMNTLFFRYCFNFSPEDTDAMLETTHSVGRLRYARNMLSSFMGLEGALVDDHSMKLACEAALSTYVAQDVSNVLRIPKYSNVFRKKLSVIKAAQKSTSMAIAIVKRVAVFILVCAISFSTALVANAKWREKFLNWAIETFPKFSIFTTQTTESPASIVLKQDDISFGYLPEAYTLSDIFEGRTMLVYDFLNDGGDKSLTISFAKAGVKSYYDTENSEIKSVIFKNAEAFTWQTDKMTYFVWVQDNIECHISGNIDYDTIVKIAENVEIKK